jgi:hypothetical protein
VEVLSRPTARSGVGGLAGVFEIRLGQRICAEGVREILRSVHPEVGEYLFFYELR